MLPSTRCNRCGHCDRPYLRGETDVATGLGPWLNLPLRSDRSRDPMGLDAFGQLSRMAEGHEVTAHDLVRLDGEALAGDSPLEACREETVIATDEDQRGNVRPRVERPRLRHRCPRLLGLATAEGLGTNLWRDIMEVDGCVVIGDVGREPKSGQVRLHRLSLAGVGPPFGPCLAWLGNHRVQEDQEFDPHPLAHQRRTEAGKLLGDEGLAGPIADRIHDRVRVRGPARRIVARRERDRYDVVPPFLQPRDDQMPVPGIAPASGISTYVVFDTSHPTFHRYDPARGLP